MKPGIISSDYTHQGQYVWLTVGCDKYEAFINNPIHKYIKKYGVKR